ncbi:uncharacterized protein [Prorops nasuta]|uniref:uncharacterized protein n=1 Tax=Prorops nasuta TaxID=863751 RepID=UPI0034CEA89B
MDRLIKPEWSTHVFAYLDDIIIVIETFEEHAEYVEKVLTALKAANLTFNPEKSELCCQQVSYLGYIIDKEGLKADPEKIAPVVQYPAPRNIKKLQRFLGMVGWYARFIDKFSEHKVPLTQLLKKDAPWKWEEAQQTAFEALKSALSSSPRLLPTLYSPDRCQQLCDRSGPDPNEQRSRASGGVREPSAEPRRTKLLHDGERVFGGIVGREEVPSLYRGYGIPSNYRPQ